VQAYSVTAAYALTGESRPYDAASASYGGIRPNSVNGAWEVAVRYDHGKNKSLDAGCGLITKNATSSAPASKCSVSSITGGVNYYVNPNVRFMLDYVHGEADAGNAGKDSPDAVMARTQLSF
jgi:phosphate-selective porin OprO/OprP